MGRTKIYKLTYMVKTIKKIVKSTRGAFLPKHSDVNKSMENLHFIDSRADRKNLKGDVLRVGADMKKATEDAKIKFCL